MRPTRFHRALIRNLHEVGAAIFERRALVGLENAGTTMGWHFFRVAYDGLFNDMVAHSMRVLDRNSQSASYWYVYRSDSKAITEFASERGIDLQLIECIAEKLKHIRDKTHFHIDRDVVFDPNVVWLQANLRGRDLALCIDSVWEILNFLHQRHLGQPFPAPEYDGSDAARIVGYLRDADIIPGL